MRPLLDSFLAVLLEVAARRSQTAAVAAVCSNVQQWPPQAGPARVAMKHPSNGLLGPWETRGEAKKAWSQTSGEHSLNMFKPFHHPTLFAHGSDPNVCSTAHFHTTAEAWISISCYDCHGYLAWQTSLHNLGLSVLLRCKLWPLGVPQSTDMSWHSGSIQKDGISKSW